MASFIKAMFYGLPSSRSNAKDFDDRQHFYPFNGGKFGGNITFEMGGKSYKIERFFGKKSEKDDELKVYENGRETLALGAVAMTVECGVRLLTDYLDGDKYFRVHYSEQNLVRARCHLSLARKMIDRLEEMQKVVEKYL